MDFLIYFLNHQTRELIQFQSCKVSKLCASRPRKPRGLLGTGRRRYGGGGRGSCTSDGVYVPLYLLACQVSYSRRPRQVFVVVYLTSFEFELTPLFVHAALDEISVVGYVTELFRWRILKLNGNAMSGQVKPPPQEPDHG